MRKFIFIYLFLLSYYNLAAEDKRTLIISITEYPPYEMLENNKPTGMAVEITKEVFKIMNQPIDFKLLPWSRTLLYLETGEIDASIEVLKTDERFEFIDFTEEVLLMETASFFVLEGSSIIYNGDFNSLKDYTLGIRKDFSYGQIFDSAVENGIFSNFVMQVYDSNRLFHLLNSKSIDIYVGDKYATFYQYKISGLTKKITRLSPDIESTPTYVAFSKNQNLKHIRDEFDKTLNELKLNGKYDLIIKMWEEKIK